MRRDAEPTQRYPFWYKCSQCNAVVRAYDKWPISHDMDGGTWMPHFISVRELFKPEYRYDALFCSVV